MAEGLFSGRTALVTGGARGIGRAISLMLASEGAHVAVNYAGNEAAASETLGQVSALGAQCFLCRADVGVPEDVRRMVQDVESRLGPIDLLVNNAAITDGKRHDQLTFEDWKRIQAVDLDGPFLTIWAVKDGMLARGYGRIVNISSMAGAEPKKVSIAYATSKAGLMHFTRCCAAAFAPHVRVNCIVVGMVDTDMLHKGAPVSGGAAALANTPMARIGQPEEIASVARFLLSDQSSFVTGDMIFASGGRV